MNQVIGGNYKGGIIKMNISGIVTLVSKRTKINLTEHATGIRDVNDSNDSTAALAGAVTFGITGAIVGASRNKSYIVELTLDNGTRLLAEIDANIYKSLSGSVYNNTLSEEEILAEQVGHEKHLNREQQKTRTLVKIAVILLAILFVPLLIMALFGNKKDNFSSQTSSPQTITKQEINQWYEQADSEIAQMTDEETIGYAKFLYEELETESGYGSHYYKYMRIAKKRNITCTGQSSDNNIECHYNG